MAWHGMVSLSITWYSAVQHPLPRSWVDCFVVKGMNILVQWRPLCIDVQEAVPKVEMTFDPVRNKQHDCQVPRPRLSPEESRLVIALANTVAVQPQLSSIAEPEQRQFVSDMAFSFLEENN